MLWGWARRLRAERLARARRPRSWAAGPAGPPPPWPGQPDALIEARDTSPTALPTRHPPLRGHRDRAGPSRAEVAQVRTAAALHDVGKLHTPREILNKPGRLTDEEFAVISATPATAPTCRGLGDPEIAAMIRHHHERLDGAGYPDGLAGEDDPARRAHHRRRRHLRRDDLHARLPARPHRKALDVLRRRPAAARRRRGRRLLRLLLRSPHRRLVGLSPPRRRSASSPGSAASPPASARAWRAPRRC